VPEPADLVRRFYDELWNEWRLDLVDDLLASDLHFRGSRGAVLEGRDAFRAYAEETRRGFPDWHNEIDELLTAGDRVAARLTWTGTNSGPFDGREPTGARVRYVGAAFFEVRSGSIARVWVVGDTDAFRRCLDM
jgi:steroid delta-isomerase-like uncharacterized protein